MLEERYSVDNPNRDKNYSEDLVNNYWNQIDVEKAYNKQKQLANNNGNNNYQRNYYQGNNNNYNRNGKY